MWADALDPETRQKAIEKLRIVVTNPKQVVSALESAARINHEIGLGSDTPVGGVTIIMNTNIDPSRLKAGNHTNIDHAKLPRKEHA